MNSKRRKKSNSPHGSAESYIKQLFLLTVILGAIQTGQAGADYTIADPYAEAVPDVITAVTDEVQSVKDGAELEDVAQWEEESRARLPEFLNDLLVIAQQLENNSSETFVLEQYTAFVDKWQVIAETYPGLAELEPLLTPILDRLLAGLPVLQPPYKDSQANPIQNLHDLYRETSQVNPWGLGAFWDVPPLEGTLKQTKITEKLREETVEGNKSEAIVHWDVVVTRNGVVVFLESIEDDVLISREIVFRDPTILHETLAQMILDGEDPDVIAVVEELVELADLNLELAYENGILDDCSYSFLYRKTLIGVKDTCVDINGDVQDFSEMAKYSPFDYVNQVELSRANSVVSSLNSSVNISADPGAPSSNAISSDTGPMENMFAFWLVGVMMPVYLWTLVGAFRMF